MSYQVFARKTRPRNFAQVVGQSHVLQALANGLDAGRVHHAFLFTGTRGVGKTTIARIFAKALNCEKGVGANPCGECGHCVDIDAGRFVDLIEIDAASRTGVDDIRELIENVQYAPTRGRHKVYLIDEVHMLSNSAFNALLKTLEEPPEHVKFILATTDPQKIPVTVLSRCLQFNLRRLDASEIRDHLAAVLTADGTEFDSAALALIARAADGSVRDALSLLDQALNFGAGKLGEDETRAMLGTVDEGRVLALFNAILAADAQAVFAQIDALQSYGTNWRSSLNELAALCQRIAVMQKAPNALPEDTPAYEQIQALAPKVSGADIQLYYQIAVAGLRDLDFAPEPRAGFEMCLLRMLAFQPAQTVLQQPQPTQAPAVAASSAAAKTPVTEPPSVAVEQPKAAIKPPQTAAQPASIQAAPAPAVLNEAETHASSVPPATSQAEALEKPVPSAQPVDISNLDWPVFAASLPLKGMLVALVENTAMINKTANSLTLGISAETASVCPEGVRRRFVELLQSRLTGIAVELVVMGEHDQAAAQTPAAKAVQAQTDRQQAAESSIENDPNIKQLVNEFDARVEPGSVQPLDLS